MGGDGAPQFGGLVHYSAHEFAAGAPAPNRYATRLREALVDEVPGDVDEVVERIGPLRELALLVPVATEFSTAPDMRDGEDESAVENRDPAGGERWRDGVAVRPVAVEVQRRAAVQRRVLPVHDGNGHRRSVPRRCRDAVRAVQIRVVAARYFADLPDGEIAGAHVVVVYGIRRDHGRVRQPDHVGVVLRVGADSDAVDAFGKDDATLPADPIEDAHLIDAGNALLDDYPSVEALDAEQVGVLGALDERAPGGLAEVVRGGRRQAEVLVRVVGGDDESVALVVDVVFVADAPRGDQRGLSVGIVRGQQVRFVGDLIAGRDDDVAFGRSLAEIDPKAAVGLFVDHLVPLGRLPHRVATHLVGAPVLVRHAVEQGRVVRRPHRVAERVFHGFREHIAAGQILDEHGVALGAAGIGAVRQVATVVADRKRAEVEILMSLGQGRLVEHRLRGVGFVCRPAGPYPVLGTGREPPLVVIVSVLDGHRFVVRFLPGLDFLEQRLCQVLVGFHDRIEVTVFRFEIGEHVGVVDGRIALIPEPVIGILHFDAVAGERVRPLFGHGRRDRHVGFRHVGVLGATGQRREDQRRREAKRRA